MANVVINPNSAVESWGDLWAADREMPNTLPVPSSPERAVAPRPKAVAWVRMAPDILRAMSLAAKHAGRSVGDVWAEAAREWLLHKSLEVEFDILSNMPERQRDAGPMSETHSRLWAAIDSSMEAIRQPHPTV